MKKSQLRLGLRIKHIIDHHGAYRMVSIAKIRKSAKRVLEEVTKSRIHISQRPGATLLL